MNTSKDRSRQGIGGYTLIEVMVAAGLLLIAISAASSLSLSMAGQEEINAIMSRAASLEENYVAAYQLGLEPAEIEALMPAEPSLHTINTVDSGTTITNVGPMESVSWDFVVRPNGASSPWAEGLWTGGDAEALRTLNIRAFRAPTY